MLIAIEGIDGSGKGTQAQLLRDQFGREGLSCTVFSFPGYGKNAFSQAVGRYLNGDFGDINAIPPYLTSLLFAGDRYSAKQSLENSLNRGEMVVCDRYVASNLAHQGAKLERNLRQEFYRWISDIEYGIYEMPRPTISFLLDLPVEMAKEMIAKKGLRSYTSMKEDYHEKDFDYLVRCKDVYEELVQDEIAGPWVRVLCADSLGVLRKQADINQEILAHIDFYKNRAEIPATSQD